MTTKNFNPYKITWLEIRAEKGVVPMVDLKKIFGCFAHYNKGHKAVYEHFPTQEKALAFISKFSNLNLTKRYVLTMFTDRQFADAKQVNGDTVISFTAKQINSRVII